MRTFKAQIIVHVEVTAGDIEAAHDLIKDFCEDLEGDVPDNFRRPHQVAWQFLKD